MEDRLTHVKEVRDVVAVTPLPAAQQPAIEVVVDYDDDDDEEENDSNSTMTMMQDASVQTSETGQDYHEEESSSSSATARRADEELINGSGGMMMGSDESDGTNEEIARCTTGDQRAATSQSLSQPYPNSSDTASDIGGLLDSDKMHPEGDDYKIVFISSDSSKSSDSLEGSFDDTGDHLHSHSRQTSSSVHDSESAAGFIDESDWDFFASRGQQPPQQPIAPTAQPLAEPAKPVALNTSSSSGSGMPRLRCLTDESRSSFGGIESPRTFMMDDFNYGWTSADENGSQRAVDDCLPWSSTVTYATRHVQTDFDAGSSVDFEAEPFNSEYETISHFINGPPPPPPPPQPGMEHFIPIWQVPASSRSSTHSLQSLLSESASNQNGSNGAAWQAQQLRGYFSRSDSKRSSGERSVEELNYHDHILSLEPTSNSFISSLYSPEGLALPGFQEYRDQIFTEIQAYTAKGDWNLSNSAASPSVAPPSTDCRLHQATHTTFRPPQYGVTTAGRPGVSSSWLAGPLLGKINNTYRIRPTGSRVAVPPAAKRWRGNVASDVSPPAVEATASAPQTTVHLSQQCSHALPEDQHQQREENQQHFHLTGQVPGSNHVSGANNTCLPSSTLRVESRGSAAANQSISASASPIDSHSKTFVTVNQLQENQPSSPAICNPVPQPSLCVSDQSTLVGKASPSGPSLVQKQQQQQSLTSQRAQVVVESSPHWKSGPLHPPPPTPAVGDHSSSSSSSSAIDGSVVATVAKTSSHALSAGGPHCPPFPSVATSTAAIEEPMEIHDDDVISHCCLAQPLSAASCPHINSPRAPLPPPESAGLDSPPPTPLPPLSPGPVAATTTVQQHQPTTTTSTTTGAPLSGKPHSYSMNGQEEDEEGKETTAVHPNDTTEPLCVVAPGEALGYSSPKHQDTAAATAVTAHEGQQPQHPHAVQTVETMSSPERAASPSPLANNNNSRFEVSVAELSPPAGLTVQDEQQRRNRPLRLLSSGDSDVVTSGDESSSGAGGGFDTDTQQETVVESLNSAAYNDLRQFAIKQSSNQKGASPTPAGDPHSDTDSSSSISSQQLKRSGSVTASPVLSDGRLTPRRQYTSYVLITQDKGKRTGGGSGNASDHVISDDESGVTVTLPKPPTAACVVEVPAASSPTGAEWMGGEGGSDSETNEESGSCVTISGNGVLTDHDLATSDDDVSESNGASKLAKYFQFELESGYTDASARKQPIVHRNPIERSSSPDPYAACQEEEEEEEVSIASMEDQDQSNSMEQETLHYESDPSDSRLDSINDDGESLYSESGASSGDEVYMDQEEELRGYNQRAIDFTLHTILEESCEESDGGERRSRMGGDKRSKEPSELEKYFTQGLGSVGQDHDGAGKRRTSFANEESEYSDTFSETSSSIYSEGRSGGEEEDETDPVELASSRLEKYFRTNFLGLEGAGHGNRAELLAATSSDGSESVGSDSEGHPSPEQQRRKKVMKTRGLRQQASGVADWSRSSLVGSDDLDDGQSDSLSTDPDSLPLDSLHHRSVSSSSSGDDDDEEEEEEEEEIVMEKTDGQFDTIKRRKKKRSAGESNQAAVEKQMAIIEDQAQQVKHWHLMKH